MAQLARKRRRQNDSSVEAVCLVNRTSHTRHVLPECEDRLERLERKSANKIQVNCSHAPSRISLRLKHQHRLSTTDEEAWRVVASAQGPQHDDSKQRIARQGRNREEWLQCLRPRQGLRAKIRAS